MKRLMLLFAALLFWCAVLLTVRISRSGSLLFFFLFWNLFLAAVPFAASLLAGRTRSFALQLAWLVIWLVFLPNAPYILTDFIHLKQRLPIPLWYDLLLLASCAGTGLLLGYASTLIVHRVTAERFGSATGWIVAIGAQLLSAFGIYLGRFLRWNSWEVVTNPAPLFADLATRLMNPFDFPKTFIVTALFGMMLMLGYVALHVLAENTRRV
jgi:uncharacterized membrane protein